MIEVISAKMEISWLTFVWRGLEVIMLIVDHIWGIGLSSKVRVLESWFYYVLFLTSGVETLEK